MDNRIEEYIPEENDTLTSGYDHLLRKSNSPVDEESHWLLTMSDIMSLLLIFLIMFFMVTRKTTTAEESMPLITESAITYKEDIEPEKDNTEYLLSGERQKIRDEIAGEIKSLDMGDDLYVAANNREVVITMKEKISFMPARAVILTETEPVLDNIAGIIKRHPEFLVEIVGHTDNVPINTVLYPSNWELSVARATSVLKYFIDRQQIDPSRLSIKGTADKKPVAPNNTPENRAQNRRVEIRLKVSEAGA